MKLVRRIYVIFLIYSVIAFYAVAISPADFWLSGVLHLSILPCLILNLVFLGYYLIRKRWKWALLSLLLYVAGYAHVRATFSLSSPTKAAGTFNVINANVRIFNSYHHLRSEGNSTSKEMIKWLAESDAEILIIQEFYNLDTSVVWNSLERIKKKFPYYYLEDAINKGRYMDIGQIIFSKSPIVNSGQIAFSNRTFNQALYADIKRGDDTIRVYNVHLESMKIEERKLFDTDDAKIQEKVKDTFSKLTRGFEHRAHQVASITEHIKQCPYPVIMGADMNDTPYSYAYHAFSSMLQNAFEAKGSGFGFTFNGKLFFLRIDNLFSSSQLDIHQFRVHRDITYSDHFPISATYSVKK